MPEQRTERGTEQRTERGTEQRTERGTEQRSGRRGTSRQAFLDAAGALLRRQGYAATGLNEIVARSGSPRGSLYFHFPGGKEELAVAAMEQSAQQLSAAIEALLASAGDPAEGVGRLVDALAAGLQASGYADGCPIATVALDAAASSEPIRIAAAAAFAAWLAPLRGALLDAGMQSEDAERRALLVLCAIEGALILARARRDVAPLHAVRRELVELVG